MKVSVEHHFLTERGSHRLKASLSSDERLNFPPELPGRKGTADVCRKGSPVVQDEAAHVTRSGESIYVLMGIRVVPRSRFVPCCYSRGLFLFRAKNPVCGIFADVSLLTFEVDEREKG